MMWIFSTEALLLTDIFHHNILLPPTIDGCNAFTFTKRLDNMKMKFTVMTHVSIVCACSPLTSYSAANICVQYLSVGFHGLTTSVSI